MGPWNTRGRMARMHESEKHVNVEVWNCWGIVILGLFPVEMLLRIQIHETMIWEINIIYSMAFATFTHRSRDAWIMP